MEDRFRRMEAMHSADSNADSSPAETVTDSGHEPHDMRPGIA